MRERVGADGPRVSFAGGPERAEALFSSMITLAEGLDLDVILRRVVDLAIDLVDARYGALGVLDQSGSGLARFVHSGLDPDARRRIGDLPRGRGLLGELIRRPEPLRLPDLTRHPASVGVPAHHPPMRTFLGVPVHVRGAVFGNLYLTDKREGEFTAEDEAVTVALAAAAAVAVENARLHQDTERLLAEGERRERWLQASSEITTQVLAGADPSEALVLAAERAAELTDGVGAVITTPPAAVEEGDTAPPVRVTVSVGLDDRLPVGSRVAAPSLTAVARTRVPRYEDDLVVTAGGSDLDVGPALLVPLDSSQTISGVLVVVLSRGVGTLGADTLRTVASFADQAALVLRQVESQRARRQLDVAADRERIAADLHDHVLQRLFALGLALQATQARLRSLPEAARRVDEAVDQLDSIVREIRTSIFDLHAVDSVPGLGGRLRSAVAELSAHAVAEPVVRLTGPVDRVGEALAVQVEAVVREGVSNAVRHGAAHSVVVTVSVDEDLVVDVTDDGVGIPDTVARSGLANLVARARASGGDADVARRAGAPGTRLLWWVPLRDGP